MSRDTRSGSSNSAACSSFSVRNETLRQVFEEVVEGFRKSRMREHGVFKDGIRQLAHHRDLNLGHDFASFDTQDGGPQNLACLFVDDDFHEAARLVHFQRARNVTHRHFCNANLEILFVGFRFGKADSAELRVNEHSVRDDAPGGRGVSILNDIGPDNPEVVIGNVRECRTALDVAERENILARGLKLFVHFDEAAGIR